MREQGPVCAAAACQVPIVCWVGGLCGLAVTRSTSMCGAGEGNDRAGAVSFDIF